MEDAPVVIGTIQPKGEIRIEYSTDNLYEENSVIIDNRTDEDIELELFKRKEAENYLQNKRNNKAVSWNKLLRYNTSTTPEMQKKGTSLINGTALNAKNWTRTLDNFMPGNGYMLTFRYLDSANYSYGAFSVSSDILSSVTKPRGIVW